MLPLLLAVVTAIADDPLPTVTLAEATDRAAATPAVLAAGDAADAAHAALRATWPARLPTVSVSANVLAYDSEQTFSLLEGGEAPDCSTFPESLQGLCAGFAEPTVVREQVTSSVTARASVPLSAQVAIDRQVGAAKASARGADAAAVAATADARYAATEAWYAAAQAEQQVDIAGRQLESLRAREKAAEAAFGAGTLTKADLLLARIAASQAEQALLVASGARDLAYARLGAATGQGGAPVRPTGLDDALPPAPPDDAALLALAEAHRPELASAHARAEAGAATASATSLARLPSVNAVGAYTHTTGQGVFAEPDTAYVGATLDWNVWAWGKASANARAANASASQLQHLEEAARVNAALDVRARALSLRTALASVEVAEATLAQAEEARRVQELRLGAGGGTLSELLDAEAALERARSAAVAARFDAWRAAAALERAVGTSPWAP